MKLLFRKIFQIVSQVFIIEASLNNIHIFYFM